MAEPDASWDQPPTYGKACSAFMHGSFCSYFCSSYLRADNGDSVNLPSGQVDDHVTN